MKRAFTVSLAVHLILLMLLVGFPKGCGAGGGTPKGTPSGSPGTPDQSKIIEKTIQVELEDPKDGIGKEKPKPSPTPSPKPSSKFVDRDCQGLQWFGGIGVTVSQSADGSVSLVNTAHKGYPAEKAGIRDGDWLLNYPRLRGEPGTDVAVSVLRNGQSMTINVTREKICTEPLPEK